MNPWIIPVVCELCGEEGMANVKSAPYLFAALFTHSNPEVCRRNIARKEAQHLARQNELEDALSVATARLKELGHT